MMMMVMTRASTPHGSVASSRVDWKAKTESDDDDDCNDDDDPSLVGRVRLGNHLTNLVPTKTPNRHHWILL